MICLKLDKIVGKGDQTPYLHIWTLPKYPGYLIVTSSYLIQILQSKIPFDLDEIGHKAFLAITFTKAPYKRGAAIFLLPSLTHTMPDDGVSQSAQPGIIL